MRASLPHLDTGAFYRAATLAVLRSGVDLDDVDAVAAVVASLELDQREDRMFLGTEDVSDEIRGPWVTAAVSKVSAHRRVREILVDEQRRWVDAHNRRAVVEGRDIGSVVFPDATVKVYLDARPEVRAARRARQMGEKPEEVLGHLRRRDDLDSSRAISPLTVPEGARVVDTSDLAFDEVVEAVLALLPPDR